MESIVIPVMHDTQEADILIKKLRVIGLDIVKVPVTISNEGFLLFVSRYLLPSLSRQD